MGRKFKILYGIILLCAPVLVHAVDFSSLKITEKTNPKIIELYEKLKSVNEKIKTINDEQLSALEENATAMKEKEQSKENRLLTAATTAATGIGGMELAQGLAEQKADKAAEQDMSAYIATMRCTYGNGKQVKAGNEEIELPGGNDATLMKYRAEYIALANDLKERKAALDMKPGIESEEILDKADLGLYDDENIGITDGAYASLYRSQMLNSEKDQEQIAADKKTSKTRVIAGGVAAGAGVVGGIVGDALINKDAPKESSKDIKREYDKKLKEATKEQQSIEKDLNQVIAENAKQVKEYNDTLKQHQNNVSKISKAPAECQGFFDDYIAEISALKSIENETDNVEQIDFPEMQDNLLTECTKCDAKGGIFNSDTMKCPCPDDKPVIKNGKCVEKPKPVADTSDTTQKDIEAIINALKERLQTLNQ